MGGSFFHRRGGDSRIERGRVEIKLGWGPKHRGRQEERVPHSKPGAKGKPGMGKRARDCLYIRKGGPAAGAFFRKI